MARRGGGGGGRPAGGRREKKGNASHQTAVKRENFWHTIMQTTRIIIVKQKLNYVKHEVTMTDYDSMQSRGQNFSKSVILKLFCQSCAAEQSNICGTAMFYFNADNAAAQKTARSKVYKLVFNPGSSVVQLDFLKVLRTFAIRACKYDFCRTLGAIRNAFSVIRLF